MFFHKKNKVAVLNPMFDFDKTDCIFFNMNGLIFTAYLNIII